MNKKGYANYKRSELFEKLKTSLGPIENISTGINAVLSKKSLEKNDECQSDRKIKRERLFFGRTF